MYIVLNKDIIINENDLIGIFNIDKLENFKKIVGNFNDNSDIINISVGNEKTLIIYKNKNRVKGIISNISPNSIKKRNK
ncbi:MAG: DUF370 domain-containing protein [Clostridia bacterium]|nr:DUF370 domain-containing protein [Clostridia bacterium]